MNNSIIRVGVVGEYQKGKSTLVNCLLDDKVAKTGGEGIATTFIPTRYTYGKIQEVQYISKGRTIHHCRLHEFLLDDHLPSDIEEVVVSLWKPILLNIDIIDTPGFKANDKDTQTTNNAINNLDFIIVLLSNKGLDTLSEQMFDYIHIVGKPFMVVINCMDYGGVLWDPLSKTNDNILNEIIGLIEGKGLHPFTIDGKKALICNLLWHWYASEQYLNDNEFQIQKMEQTIKYFASNFLKMNPINPLELSKKSNFLKLRNVFENSDILGFPMNYIKWNSQLNNQLSIWCDTINKSLNLL